MEFKKATKQTAKNKIALMGSSGSGKTYSALRLASGLGQKIAVIDTERGSASLYADKWNYDVLELEPPYTPQKYIEAIKAAEDAGYDVLIIDSLSHAWAGEGGMLEMHDKATSALKNSWAAWREVTPWHNRLVDTIIGANMHVIATFRTRTAYEVQKTDDGKVKPVKIGLAPQFREGVEYEFTLVFELSQDHVATATKDRTSLFDGIHDVITEDTGQLIQQWLSGVKSTPPQKTTQKKYSLDKIRERLAKVDSEEKAQQAIQWIYEHIDEIDATRDEIDSVVNETMARFSPVIDSEE